MKFKHNYGSEVLNNAYENFYKGEHISYEEFVIMLSTNDELYFMYNKKEYQIDTLFCLLLNLVCKLYLSCCCLINQMKYKFCMILYF